MPEKNLALEKSPSCSSVGQLGELFYGLDLRNLVLAKVLLKPQHISLDFKLSELEREGEASEEQATSKVSGEI